MNLSDRGALLLGLSVLALVDAVLGALLVAAAYLLAGAFDLSRTPVVFLTASGWVTYVTCDYVTTYRRAR
jgi:hypothetical protein